MIPFVVIVLGVFANEKPGFRNGRLSGDLEWPLSGDHWGAEAESAGKLVIAPPPDLG